MTFLGSTLIWAGVCLLLWILLGLVICRFFAITDDLDEIEDDAPRGWWNEKGDDDA